MRAFHREAPFCIPIDLFDEKKFKEKEMLQMAANVETMFSVREKPAWIRDDRYEGADIVRSITACRT